MLKASLFTLIFGLVSGAKLPVFAAFSCLAVLPALEITYFALHHHAAPDNFGGDFLALFLIGLSGFYTATCFLLGGQLRSQQK